MSKSDEKETKADKAPEKPASTNVAQESAMKQPQGNEKQDDVETKEKKSDGSKEEDPNAPEKNCASMLATMKQMVPREKKEASNDWENGAKGKRPKEEREESEAEPKRKKSRLEEPAKETKVDKSDVKPQNKKELKKLQPGDRISVYWPMEKAHYSGTLVKENSPGQWLIQYDDGDLRLHALNSDAWQYSIPEGKPAGGTRDMSWEAEEADEEPEEEADAAVPPSSKSKPGSKPINEKPETGKPPPEYLVSSWGRTFERARHAALAESNILLGLIQSIPPSNPSLINTMTTFARRLRDMTHFCSSLLENQGGTDMKATGKRPPNARPMDDSSKMYSTPQVPMQSMPENGSQMVPMMMMQPQKPMLAQAMPMAGTPGMPMSMPMPMRPGMPGVPDASMRGDPAMMMHKDRVPMRPQQHMYMQQPHRMPYQGQRMGMKLRPPYN